MKEKFIKVYPIIYITVFVLIAFWLLSSCEKNHNQNGCVNVFETFEDIDYFNEYYYKRCEKISSNEEEIDRCMDEMRLTTKEIKDFCDVYIELNEDYDEYREY
jgi:hypothetical protein